MSEKTRGAMIALVAVGSISCQSDAEKLRELRLRETTLSVQLQAAERDSERMADSIWNAHGEVTWELMKDAGVPNTTTLRDSLDLVRRDITRLLR